MSKDMVDIEIDLPDDVFEALMEECKRDNCTLDEKVNEILEKVLEDDKI